MLSVSVLAPGHVSPYEALIFPRHREILADERHSDRFVVVGAAVMGMPVGLAVAELILPDVAVLSSVAVIERARSRGLATELLVQIETTLRARGVKWIDAVYRTDRPHSQATSRLLVRRGFQQNADRPVVTLEFRVARLLEASALNIPCPGAAVVDYSCEQLELLQQHSRGSPITPEQLSPGANDPRLATLVTYAGKMAACALGFQSDAETAHLALIFVHPELRRQGLAGFVTRQFLSRLRDRGLNKVSYEVGLNNSASLAFFDGKLGVLASSRAIVCVARKSLEHDQKP